MAKRLNKENLWWSYLQVSYSILYLRQECGLWSTYIDSRSWQRDYPPVNLVYVKSSVLCPVHTQTGVTLSFKGTYFSFSFPSVPLPPSPSKTYIMYRNWVWVLLASKFYSFAFKTSSCGHSFQVLSHHLATQHYTQHHTTTPHQFMPSQHLSWSVQQNFEWYWLHYSSTLILQYITSYNISYS